MTGSNVNPTGKSSNEVNIKRLGQQQKELLRFLYRNEGVRQQVAIIEELYGEVTNSRKASVSRSISKLREHDLVHEQNVVYYPNMDEWFRSRPRYGITDTGERFVEHDSRFPDIQTNDNLGGAE